MKKSLTKNFITLSSCQLYNAKTRRIDAMESTLILAMSGFLEYINEFTSTAATATVSKSSL